MIKEWQPISIAPPNETPLLVWDGENQSVAEYSTSLGDWLGLVAGDYPWESTDIIARVYDVTHWMPLPEPPK